MEHQLAPSIVYPVRLFVILILCMLLQLAVVAPLDLDIVIKIAALFDSHQALTLQLELLEKNNREHIQEHRQECARLKQRLLGLGVAESPAGGAAQGSLGPSPVARPRKKSRK